MRDIGVTGLSRLIVRVMEPCVKGVEKEISKRLLCVMGEKANRA